MEIVSPPMLRFSGQPAVLGRRSARPGTESCSIVPGKSQHTIRLTKLHSNLMLTSLFRSDGSAGFRY
jgi:hypothetical protein